MTEHQRKGGETRDRERTGQADKSVALLVPCHNEASAVAQVMQEFRRNLPAALIYVYDNSSTDDTAQIARGSGAILRAQL
jgi:glycosyltransferase involved in cell wall biosynthesis